MTRISAISGGVSPYGSKEEAYLLRSVADGGFAIVPIQSETPELTELEEDLCNLDRQIASVPEWAKWLWSSNMAALYLKRKEIIDKILELDPDFKDPFKDFLSVLEFAKNQIRGDGEASTSYSLPLNPLRK